MISAQLRKAAIVFASLDRASAESLLKQMPRDFAKRVLAAAQELGAIDPDEQQAVMRDFLARKAGASAPLPGAASPEVELSLSQTTEGASSKLVERMSSPEPAPITSEPGRFSFVTEDAAAPLAAILRNEQPRLAALILTHLPAERSAAVLAQVDRESRLAIIECIADIDEAAPEVLNELEQELKARLLRKKLNLEGSRQGLAALSSILQASDPEIRGQITHAMAARRKPRVLADRAVDSAAAAHIHSISEPNQVLTTSAKADLPTLGGNESVAKPFDVISAESLARLQPVAESNSRDESVAFAFSGLTSLDDVSLAAVFGAVSPQIALLALVGADETLVRRILSKLPRRDAASFRKRLEEVGPLRLKEVEQAQNRVSQAADELLQQRRISLPAHERAPLAA